MAPNPGALLRFSDDDRRELHDTLTALLDAGDSTLPSLGPSSAKRKNYYAESVLTGATILMRQVCSWAIHHKIGALLAALDSGNPRDLHENDHALEHNGATYIAGRYPRQDRHILVRTLLFGTFLPEQLVGLLKNALEALEVGEIQPLVSPRQRVAWANTYSLDELRFKGLQHVYFLTGAGVKKMKAYATAANAFGVSLATVRNWEARRVPKSHGNEIIRILAVCRRAGKIDARLATDPDYTTHDRLALVMRGELSKRLLKDLGQDYKKASRKAKKKNRRSIT